MSSEKKLWPPKGSRKVHIVHVESPSEIYVRDETLQEKWNVREEMFKRVMVEHLRTKFKSTLSPENLPGKSVMLKIETVLHRGKVLHIDTVHSNELNTFVTCRLVDCGHELNTFVTCRLVDCGRVEVVPITDLMPMPKVVYF